jgi:hypothetical protein
LEVAAAEEEEAEETETPALNAPISPDPDEPLACELLLLLLIAPDNGEEGNAEDGTIEAEVGWPTDPGDDPEAEDRGGATGSVLCKEPISGTLYYAPLEIPPTCEEEEEERGRGD